MSLLKKKEKKTFEPIQSKENKIDKIEKAARQLGLSYNFAAVKYILDVENISFGLLRCAQFFDGNDKYYTDFNRAAYYLVLAGLIGSGQESKIDKVKLEAHTCKILDDWMEKYGDLSLLFLQLIKQLEERHFFMNSATLEIMEQMSLQSSYKPYRELVASVIALEIQEQKQKANILLSSIQHITHSSLT